MTESYYSSRRPPQQQYDRQEDSDISKTEFRRPRDILLSVVSEFLTICSARLVVLSKKLQDLSSKSTELLDNKCHFVSVLFLRVLLFNNSLYCNLEK